MQSRAAPPGLPADKQRVIDRLKTWVETDLAVALSQSDTVTIEIHIKDNDIKASARTFYNLPK